MRRSPAVFLALLLAVAQADEDLQCSRLSPQEIWYSDFLPLVNGSLTEMKTYFEVVFEKLDGNMWILIPHVQEDRDKASNLTHGFSILQDLVSNAVERAEQLTREPWLRLGHTYDAYLESPSSQNQARVLQDLNDLQQAYNLVQELLSNACREMAFFMKGLLNEAMEGVALMLEAELEEAPDNDGETAKLMQKKIGQVAPGNFVGFVLQRILGRGLAPGRYRNSDPILFRDTNNRLAQIIADLHEALQANDNAGVETWEQFWESQLAKSVKETSERVNKSQDNYRKIFSNDVYVAELMMNLMAYY